MHSKSVACNEMVYRYIRYWQSNPETQKTCKHMAALPCKVKTREEVMRPRLELRTDTVAISNSNLARSNARK